MENEEKKDVVTEPAAKPTESPEELAKKLRDKNDLRIFGIAFMAAVIVVAFYHIGRMVHRKYFNKFPVKSCQCRYQKHPGKPGKRRGKPGKTDKPGKPQCAPQKDAKPDAAPVKPVKENKPDAAPASKRTVTAPATVVGTPAPAQVKPAGEKK